MRELEFGINDLGRAAKWFWENAGGNRVFAFHGEMGAGKTTLIQAICREKGVKEGMGSPTFSIINEYVSADGLNRIYHMDLYRLKSAEEAVQAGVEECFYSDETCFVEWPERAPGIFPDETTQVYIRILDSANRKLQIDRN
ncbi:MAG: tRNA (adenosine(37)-N6)-threonylcarbamoyltransferase complex ATPase subunit type 1 TsaE [Chitinophagaceae bacterium]|nr:MAG: tRNA (adenosine(37)-N6)-threonylcarbamoyltransferase complex ATPase subunit type 1 TsaE [Chitinophagaceae bacterium]